MKPVKNILEKRITEAMAKITSRSDCLALVRHSAEPKFGDYQANGVMALAKSLKTNPRQMAEEVVGDLKVDDICQPPEIAGPGFINFRLKPEFIAQRVLEINNDTANRIGIDKTAERKTIVVDFSSPNIAKQMHVGHLRSTIIGDCICRVFEFLGHNVIRQNHIGDWGTQFGMLIAYLKKQNPEVLENPESVHIADLEEFYRKAKTCFDSDAEFEKLSRSEVVNLHNHDADTLRIWRHIVDESRTHYQPIYDTLGANLHAENECGESFYADRLSGIVDELEAKGIAEESEGAMCVFLEGYKGKDDQPTPFIVRKSDGAFLYATTDLAAIKYRIEELGADRVIYVTDARQKLHFEMLFATARLAAWTKEDTVLDHVSFGTMLGEDGTPFKTRSGGVVKLSDLLSDAVELAQRVVEAKNPDLDEKTKAQIAKAVGIGAVKYADYSNNRNSDYVFSFEKMLAMDGNTAPYMQYAYARVKSIERRALQKNIDIAEELAGIEKPELIEDEELTLAKHLIRYGEAIELAAADSRPNYLTGYLYDLAQKFSSFYNACPVLAAKDTKRPARLLLCDLTAKTIKHGLSELLGIEVAEQM